MNNYNIDELARQMGFNDTYFNKLKASNSYITESANKDRDMINSQLNQTITDYERERQNQNNQFIKDSQAAYIDYAKSINPYSVQNSNTNRMGLGNSGYSESSLIGANNTYQNRYTANKNNYDNIFANINDNIAKAKETGNIELAKIAKQEQERLLENLYRINDEYTAEKQREEEKRRYEEQMAYQKQRDAVADSQWAKEYALSRSKASSSSSGNTVNTNDNVSQNGTVSQMAEKLYGGISGLLQNNSKANQETARQLIYNERSKGAISEEEATTLFKEFGL